MTVPAQPTVARPDVTRWERMRGPVLTIGGLAVATLALHLRDPHEGGSWGYCPSATLLGIYCPGCGGLRAVNDLTNGDVGAAASSNLLFVVLLPFIVAGLALWALRRWRGDDRRLTDRVTPRVVYAGVAVLIAFMVLRNLSVAGWLAP